MFKRVAIALIAGAVVVGAAIVLMPGGAARTAITAWRQRLSPQPAAPPPVRSDAGMPSSQSPPLPPSTVTPGVDAAAGGPAAPPARPPRPVRGARPAPRT